MLFGTHSGTNTGTWKTSQRRLMRSRRRLLIGFLGVFAFGEALAEVNSTVWSHPVQRLCGPKHSSWGIRISRGPSASTAGSQLRILVEWFCSGVFAFGGALDRSTREVAGVIVVIRRFEECHMEKNPRQPLFWLFL